MYVNTWEFEYIFFYCYLFDVEFFFQSQSWFGGKKKNLPGSLPPTSGRSMVGHPEAVILIKISGLKCLHVAGDLRTVTLHVGAP